MPLYQLVSAPNRHFEIKLYRTRGLNPCVRPKGRAAASPPSGVMDRDSTGETPSALYPPQEAGFTLNQALGLDKDKFIQATALTGII
jgi:hypothetical protein